MNGFVTVDVWSIIRELRDLGKMAAALAVELDWIEEKGSPRDEEAIRYVIPNFRTNTVRHFRRVNRLLNDGNTEDFACGDSVRNALEGAHWVLNKHLRIHTPEDGEEVVYFGCELVNEFGENPDEPYFKNPFHRWPGQCDCGTHLLCLKSAFSYTDRLSARQLSDDRKEADNKSRAAWLLDGRRKRTSVPIPPTERPLTIDSANEWKGSGSPLQELYSDVMLTFRGRSRAIVDALWSGQLTDLTTLRAKVWGDEPIDDKSIREAVKRARLAIDKERRFKIRFAIHSCDDVFRIEHLAETNK